MTEGKASIKLLGTGVPGFDQVLGGGLPEFSFNLIAGAPGSGKTTLAHQLMFALVTPERPAIYFTVLGEPPLKMLRYQQQFNFFDSAQVGRNIHFISLSEEASHGDLSKVLERITSEVKTRAPALVFIDSFRSVLSTNRSAELSSISVREFIQHLGTLMTGWQATTFLLGEYSTQSEQDPVFSIADGLIWLRQSVERNTAVRQIEIVKMRGRASESGLHAFRITANGIDVTPAG